MWIHYSPMTAYGPSHLCMFSRCGKICNSLFDVFIECLFALVFVILFLRLRQTTPDPMKTVNTKQHTTYIVICTFPWVSSEKTQWYCILNYATFAILFAKTCILLHINFTYINCFFLVLQDSSCVIVLFWSAPIFELFVYFVLKINEMIKVSHIFQLVLIFWEFTLCLEKIKTQFMKSI